MSCRNQVRAISGVCHFKMRIMRRDREVRHLPQENIFTFSSRADLKYGVQKKVFIEAKEGTREGGGGVLVCVFKKIFDNYYGGP